MYIINTIAYGKCFVRYLRTRCFCIRNLTRSLRSLVRFLIRQQLVLKYRAPAVSMKYSLSPQLFFFFFFFFPFFSFFLFLRCIIACIELWGLHFQRHWTKSKGNRQSWSAWSMSWGNWYHFQIIFCARENETNQIHCLEHTMVVTLFLAFRMFLCWLLREIPKIRCNRLFVECPSSSCNLDQLPWTGAN